MSTIDDLIDRWEEARDRGEHIAPEDLCADHPELLADVKSQIEVLIRFDSDFGFHTQTGAVRSQKTAKAFEPPQQFSLNSRYRLQGCHAVGGIGQVFLAFDEVLQRRVAIKFPKLQGMTAQQIARFEQEARITGQLDHPGIVPIHAMAAEASGEPCYVMRFVEGRTLDQAVRAARAESADERSAAYFDTDEFRKLVQSLIAICNTVAFAHDRNILHRDIKPNNILIGPFGETLLLDWGIAKPLESAQQPFPESAARYQTSASPIASIHSANSIDSPQLTEPGHGLGTPAYASPEQLLGRSEQQKFPSDVFSLGATLFFIIAGKSPLESIGWTPYLEQLRQSQTDFSRLLATETPPALRAICTKALQIDPAQRYQSSQELARDLDHYLGREPVSVFSESIWSRMARKARKHPTLTGGLIAGIAALSTAGLIGSAIVGSKNQQLSGSNKQLAVALKTSQDANVIAMTSLRSMVNEAVSHRMAQRESLSDGDRAYIESILQQYLALAGVQGDSAHALAIRAEAEGQVGALHYQLNEREDATEHLESCRTLYQQLRKLRQTDADTIALIGYLEVLAAIRFEDGQFEKCHQTAEEAIDLLTQRQNSAGNPASERPAAKDSSVDENTIVPISTLADLTMIRAEAGQALGAHDESLNDFRKSAALMEEALKNRPDDASIMFAAGSNLRTYASYLNERATSKVQRREALKLADKAVELLDAATKRHPDLHRYQSSLAWAYYDRSFIHESLENTKDAIQDMWYAGSITEKLTDRFPLLSTYRDRVPAMIARRCQLYLSIREPVHAYTDARNFSDLELTADQCSQGIDLLQQALDADADDVLDRVDAICHIAHLHARRGRALREAGEPERGLDEYNKACQKMKDLGDEPKLTTYTSFSFLWSLERIEVLLLLKRYDEAIPLFDEAVVRRQAVRNFYDDTQLQAIDAQLENFYTQLKAAK